MYKVLDLGFSKFKVKFKVLWLKKIRKIKYIENKKSASLEILIGSNKNMVISLINGDWFEKLPD